MKNKAKKFPSLLEKTKLRRPEINKYYCGEIHQSELPGQRVIPESAGRGALAGRQGSDAFAFLGRKLSDVL